MAASVRFATVTFCIVLTLLGGCTVGPNYRPKSAPDLGVPAAYLAAPSAPLTDLSHWWTAFDDPVLVLLVERATANNLDLAQSAERLAQAREALVQAGGARLPSLSGSASGGRNFNSQFGDSDSFSAGLNARWSADLFGALRRGQEASAASLDAAGFDLASLRIAIASQVATNYVNYRSAAARLVIARDTLRYQNDNLEIAGFRAQAGLVSSLDVEQARTQRAQTAATIPLLEQSIATARNQLSILTGAAPGAVDAELAPVAPIPAGSASLAAGIPADTLRQRPDVRSSERQLAAATARIGVAKAQLYPQLTLTGNVGTSALSIGSLGDAVTGGLFGSLAQTIFQGGQLRSQVRSQEAAARGAFASYKSSVLGALQDVENGLVALRTANDRARELAVAAEAANNAAILARSQYRAGLTDFRTLLTAEQSLLSARDGFANAQAAQATSLIQLYLALGGGWNPAAPLTDTRR